MIADELKAPIVRAFDYLIRKGEEIPADVWSKSIRAGVFKAEEAGDLDAINARYHDVITAALLTYIEGGSITGPRNQFKKATVEAFGAAFDTGWLAGGGEGVPDRDALAWFNARVEVELGYVDMLFQQAKELQSEEEFAALEWVSEKADSYTNTLKEIYNNAKLRATTDIMVTFDGDDGVEPCDTCQKLKGKRHKISWFVKRNYIPPHGSGLDCAKGGHCKHGLRKDDREWITI
jgi:hypothetical protein